MVAIIIIGTIIIIRLKVPSSDTNVVYFRIRV